jgi:hypothetical protein
MAVLTGAATIESTSAAPVPDEAGRMAAAIVRG